MPATIERIHPSTRLSGETLAQLTGLPRFRGATVVDVEPLSPACVRVRFADGRRAVVSTAAASDRVAHEVAVLARLHPLGLPAPRPVGLLTGAAALVTEDDDGFTPLDRRRAQAGGSSLAWAAAAGRGLAAVHTGVTPARLPHSDPPRYLLRAWTSGHPSGGRPTFLAEPGLLDALDDAVAGWRPACLVHADVRPRTVLCGPTADGPRPLVFVGWSRAGHGDPRWDVGCLIGSYLAGWLSGAGDGTFGPVRAEIRAATGAYETACEAARPVTPADRRQWLRYAAVVLLREACRDGDASAALVEVAAHLLHRPDACGELLP